MPRARIGRPRVRINNDVVRAMASVGATDTEIGDYVGTTGQMISRRYGTVLAKERSGLKLRLRQAQMRSAFGTPAVTQVNEQGQTIVVTPAIPPSWTMQIFLGKVMLQQKEASVVELREIPQVVVE